MNAPILVAGIGNVFLGDDGFGVELARRLAQEDFPPEVQVVDYGIRGLHLAYELLEPKRLLIVLDAVSRRESPGTLFLIEPELDGSIGQADAHAMDLPSVFRSLGALGGKPPRTRIVGCEPATIEESMALSPPVSRAIAGGVDLVRELIARELGLG